jgi:hypothetical protein
VGGVAGRWHSTGSSKPVALNEDQQAGAGRPRRGQLEPGGHRRRADPVGCWLTMTARAVGGE